MRNRLAADRTLMAWIRTALSMITFGFTIYKFLEYVREREGTGIRVEGPRNLGLSLILLGTGGLVAASIQPWKRLRDLGARKTKHLWASTCPPASIITPFRLFPFLSRPFTPAPF